MPKRFLLLVIASGLVAFAHVGNHPSVHDTTAGVIERLRKSGKAFEAVKWKAPQAEAYITPEERAIFAREHIRFNVSAPVKVLIVRGKDPAEELFWLKSEGFKTNAISWTENKIKLTVWEKDFPAGEVGLGVNSLTGGGTHYAVILQGPTNVIVSDIYPARLRVGTLTNGAKIYADAETKYAAVPEELKGSTFIQTLNGARDDAKLISIFRLTDHRASEKPDQVILTWSEDPRRTQTIQWRTSFKVKNGNVRFQKKSDASVLRRSRGSVKQVKALSEQLLTPMLINDPLVMRHTAILRGLEPDTTYIYSVGNGAAERWSEEFEFTTAPDRVKPFSFMYMGDAQNGLDRWGSLLKSAYRNRPDAAFYIMAGDLVNRGADRDDWDSLFYNSAGIYDRRQLIPVLGNHECQGGQPKLYLKQFALMTNGPSNIEKERAYSFEYSNALFVVLDSNLPAASQTNWLAQTLESSKATWKFVTYHHPAFSSGVSRDNKGVRELWTPIFDKYHVDVALQGHDHAYLRTFPMKGQKPVAKPEDGTIYVVSVSGQKFYAQDKRNYTQIGFTNVATIQVLDIQIDGDRLLYRSYDGDRKIRDEFVIEKKPRP